MEVEEGNVEYTTAKEKLIEMGFAKKLSFPTVDKYSKWLVLQPNEETPEHSTMTCRICRDYSRRFYIRHRNQFEGNVQIKSTPIENNRLLRDHALSKSHLETEALYTRLRADHTDEEIKNAVEASLMPELKQTYNALRTCWQCIKSKVSYHQYPNFIELGTAMQAQNGGYCRTSWYCRAMTMTMDQLEAQSTIDIIKRFPFSLISDG